MFRSVARPTMAATAAARTYDDVEYEEEEDANIVAVRKAAIRGTAALAVVLMCVP